MINKALFLKKTREDRTQIPVKDDIYYFLFKSISFSKSISFLILIAIFTRLDSYVTIACDINATYYIDYLALGEF